MLASKFVSAFNSILRGNPISKVASHSHIAVLLKPDKDPSLCASYRPISEYGSEVVYENIKFKTSLL